MLARRESEEGQPARLTNGRACRRDSAWRCPRRRSRRLRACPPAMGGACPRPRRSSRERREVTLRRSGRASYDRAKRVACHGSGRVMSRAWRRAPLAWASSGLAPGPLVLRLQPKGPPKGERDELDATVVLPDPQPDDL